MAKSKCDSSKDPLFKLRGTLTLCLRCPECDSVHVYRDPRVLPPELMCDECGFEGDQIFFEVYT